MELLENLIYGSLFGGSGGGDSAHTVTIKEDHDLSGYIVTELADDVPEEGSFLYVLTKPAVVSPFDVTEEKRRVIAVGFINGADSGLVVCADRSLGQRPSFEVVEHATESLIGKHSYIYAGDVFTRIQY